MQGFQTIWTTNYLFTEVRCKAVCLVCGEHIAVFKDYNLNRHYQTKHAETYKNLTDAERARTSDAFLAKLQKQQCFFFFYQASRSHRCSNQDQELSKHEETCAEDVGSLWLYLHMWTNILTDEVYQIQVQILSPPWSPVSSASHLHLRLSTWLWCTC